MKTLISRKGFSKLIILALLCGLAFSPAASANASPASGSDHHTWTVLPLGKSPDDAVNIQQVVDQASPGDKISLGEGVFDFGDYDSVSISKDLTIEGAWDEGRKQPLTVIKGGFVPLAIGRMDPGLKPETLTVNGHSVLHITQDLFGRFYFPFLYPPYYDQEAMTWVEPYVMQEHWSAVDATVRQITFKRPLYQAIFSSGMRGGAIERCRFISVWPLQGDFLQAGWHSFAMQFWNLQGSMGWASDFFSLPEFAPGADFVRGDILVRDNVFKGDYFGEIQEGAKDENGDVIFVPFDGNTAPPKNDYDHYYLEDLYTYPQMFDLKPVESPSMYWVRKGYDAAWTWVNGEMQVLAYRGQLMGIHMFDTQANMTVRNNIFHDQILAINLGPNGQFGTPFNIIIKENTFKADIYSIYPYGEAVLIADLYGGSPGTNAVVEDNAFNLAYTGPGNSGGPWYSSSIDLGIMGKAIVAGNTIKMNSEGGISFWGPTQNAVAKDNRIMGAGDYAFASFFSNGNKFIQNRVDRFSPTGPGVYDLGWGWPVDPIPAARGILYASDSNLVHGTGEPGPLDIVYDCGNDNTIENMIAMPCPAAEGAASAATIRGSSGQAMWYSEMNPFIGKWRQLPEK